MAAETVFVDTSLIVPASVDGHPSHSVATASLASLIAEKALLCISPQICREFMVTLTRRPLAGRTFTVEEALGSLERWRSECTLLEETAGSVAELLRLVRQHQVHGKQVHDCNIVAVMLAHGVRRLATRNAADFARYAGEIRIEAVGS